VSIPPSHQVPCDHAHPKPSTRRISSAREIAATFLHANEPESGIIAAVAIAAVNELRKDLVVEQGSSFFQKWLLNPPTLNRTVARGNLHPDGTGATMPDTDLGDSRRGAAGRHYKQTHLNRFDTRTCWGVASGGG